MQSRLRSLSALYVFALIPSSIAADEPFATDVRLDLRGGLRALPSGAELIAAAASDGSERRWPLEQNLVVELPADQSWELTCAAPKLWCPRLEVRSAGEEAGPRNISLPVYRGVLVRGRVRAPRSAGLPQPVSLKERSGKGFDRPARSCSRG